MSASPRIGDVGFRRPIVPNAYTVVFFVSKQVWTLASSDIVSNPTVEFKKAFASDKLRWEQIRVLSGGLNHVERTSIGYFHLPRGIVVVRGEEGQGRVNLTLSSFFAKMNLT